MLQFLAQYVRRHWSVPLHIALALLFTAALAVELFGLHALDTTEHRLTDVSMVRHAPEHHADPGIVIIDIDNRSMAAMEGAAGLWPWPREIHADLLEALAQFAPRAIVFDVTFYEHDLKRPKSDARLSSAIVAMPNVYLPAVRFDSGRDAAAMPLRELSKPFGMTQAGAKNAMAILQLPQAVVRDGWRLGLINSLEDGDGVLRRYRLYTDVHGWRLPSLPAHVVSDLGVALPTASDFMLRWPEHDHKKYSYSELYLLLTEGRSQLNADMERELAASFRDKIIVIGSSVASAYDHHLTPLGANYPGVDVLAVALDNLKNGDAVRLAPGSAPFGFGVVLIVLLALAFARRMGPVTIGLSLTVVSVAALLAADAALGRNLLLPLATPLIFAWSLFLCGAIGGYIRERRARDHAVSMFGRFLNPAVVRQIVEQGLTVDSLSGRTCNISILFSDIRGFTTLSESHPPHEVVALLNRHFERQVEVVFRHGGTLDKFIGDCIMAFWGAPVDDANHARHAVAAAMEMQDALIAFRQELVAEGSDVADMDVGIGVHSGPAVVGFIGAKRKVDYTAIGDNVNLASRVEGLTKGVARVLVTRDTVFACGEWDAFSFEPHGAFAVKGRAAEVELYEPKRKLT